jgi:hypothetical protein
MLGPTFGAFGASGCHFFDEMHPTYRDRGDWSDAELADPPRDRTTSVTFRLDGRAVIHIDLPPAAMALLA